MLNRIKKFKIFDIARPIYHFSLAFLGALIYRFPSRKIKVVAVTGTKGKTSVVEILGAILEEAGYKTSLASTLRFKIVNESKNNLYKMTMPGRFFIQSFLRKAVNAGTEYAVIEMTSEGAKQFRHKFISLDALLFTNISPEHIESHGSFEKYLNAKLKIAKALENSSKKDKVIVANIDDENGDKFLNLKNVSKFPYSLKDAEPYEIYDEGVKFSFNGQEINSRLSGKFNIYNMLAAATYAVSQGVDTEIIKRALDKFTGIRGRVERINEGQNFNVIVDYAHTPDSLEKLYEVFQNSKRICVLGNTGGGRDKWKRTEMAKIADNNCDHIILTNEDPYDEDPEAIVKTMKEAITNTEAEIIMDRREAIRKAISLAEGGDSVLITGKGTDPYIMEANGKKTPWSDSKVCHEEIKKLLI